MFRAKTVLVLGAGASCEVGLPEGSALLTTIARLLTFRFEHSSEPTQGDRTIFYALRERLKEGTDVTRLNEHLRAAVQITQSAVQAISIDNVIDMLEDANAEAVGKLGISKAILDAEADSDYFRAIPDRPYELNIARFPSTWYSRLTKILTEGVRRSNIKHLFDNLTIINFNYDRCLENYLCYSISNYYGIALAEAQKLVDQLPMYRPYGRVGKLPWQSGGEPAIEFGRRGVREVNEAALQLRTFTEQIEEGETLASMRDALAAADRIVFLGFAFHRQNMKLLAVNRDEIPEILATAYKVSGSDRGVITSELNDAFGLGLLQDNANIELFGKPCVDLFDEYWRTLTATPRE